MPGGPSDKVPKRVAMSLLACSFLVLGNTSYSSAADGGRIVAVRITNEEVWRLMLMSPDGSSKTQIEGAQPATDPAWSPDGTKIAYMSLHDSSLRVINADGSGDHAVTSEQSSLACCDNFDWSPDGQRIVYVPTTSTVWTAREDGTDAQELTERQGSVSTPRWSPDGAQIAFVSNRSTPEAQTDRDWEIYVMDADGSNERRLTDMDLAGSGTADIDVFDWSPDSRRILFNDHGDIWSMKADGTDQVQLTNSLRRDSAALFSPDGSQVAFTRFAADFSAGSEEVYVMPSNGIGNTRLTHNRRVDWFMGWSPSGSHVTYSAGKDGKWSEIRTAADDGSEHARLTPRRGRWSSADWHAGGM